MQAANALEIGPFELLKAERTLCCEGAPVRMPAGGTEMLLALLERPGADVPVKALEGSLRQSLPGHVVDLVSLSERVNAVLATGTADHYVAQINDDTLTFVGTVAKARRKDSGGDWRPGALPSLPAEVVGREETIQAIYRKLEEGRLVTLLGPGGVGKTTAAVATALQAGTSFEDGVFFVDLAPVSQDIAVARAVLVALGWECRGGEDGLEGLQGYLHEAFAGRELLLVVDNCEHVALAAANIIELALRSPRLRVLATSREPLRTFGERTLVIQPMDVPPPSAEPELDGADTFSAVHLFALKAFGPSRAGRLSGKDLSAAYDICRHLDGLPLALELAAAHVPSLGLQGLRAHLASSCRLEDVSRARVTHRTLEATLDWSYALLDRDAQVVLARTSVFRGEFSLESAVAVVADETLDEAAATSALLELQSKSLLSTSFRDGVAQFRLLETTRVYALSRLQQQGTESAARLRHAKEIRACLERAEQNWSHTNTRAWRGRYGRLVDDVRAAIEWALGDSGDRLLGSELVVLSLPLACRLALFDEYRELLKRGIGILTQGGMEQQPELEMKMYASLRSIGINLRERVEDLPGSDERILELVERLPDRRAQLGAWVSLWLGAMRRADYPRAVQYAQRQLDWTAVPENLADSSDEQNQVDRVDAQKCAAYALHFHGDQRGARQYAEDTLDNLPDAVPVAYYNVSQVHIGVSMRITLSRVQWVEGDPTRAMATAMEALALTDDDRPLAACLVLSLAAIPIAISTGDNRLARQLTKKLHSTATRHRLAPHQDWADWFDAVVATPEASRSFIPTTVASCDALQADFLATVGCTAFLAQTLQRVEVGTVGWCAPQILRLHAECLLAEGDLQGARVHLVRARELSISRGTHLWLPRIEASLVGLEVVMA